MSKSDKEKTNQKLKRRTYEEELRRLQAELCVLQSWVKAKGLRVIVVLYWFSGTLSLEVSSLASGG